VKAFGFRLDQARRWRTTQAEIEKSRFSVAAHAVRQIHCEIDRHHADLSQGSAQLAEGYPAGASFELWGAFTERSSRRIKELGLKAAEAEKALAAQREVMVEADRKLRLLENLKQKAQVEWRAEFNRELEAFAGEGYLFRLQSKKGRARSSGG
jgi:flagellar export protein FliJ